MNTLGRGFLAAALGLSTWALPADALVVINEVVTDPQQDWSGGGFTLIPGVGTPDSGDEWVELYNSGASSIDLSGWSIQFVDTSPATYVLGSAGPILLFSSGSLTNFPPGARCVIGDPPGVMNDDIYLVLRDAGSNLVDDVELGDDPEADGIGDGAPDGTAEGGNASSIATEAVARIPNAVDTNGDIADFDRGPATIGEVNPGSVGVELYARPSLSLVPNPLQSSGLLRFGQAAPAPVRIAVYDLNGREIQVVCDATLSTGTHIWTLSMAGAPSGLYFVRVANGGRATRTLRFVLLR